MVPAPCCLAPWRLRQARPPAGDLGRRSTVLAFFAATVRVAVSATVCVAVSATVCVAGAAGRAAAAGSAAVPDAAIDAAGPLGSCPADDARACLAERLRPYAEAAARAAVAPPDRLEPISYRFGGADAPGGTTLTAEPLAVDGPNASGVVRLRFRLLAGGVARGEARATVRGVVRGPALLSRATLRRGEIVDAGDVEIVDAELTRLRELPLRETRELEGLVPSRTLGPGRAITPALLMPAPVVRRGDVVEMQVQQPRFRITAHARALRDGAPGQTIPAENVSSGAVVLAEVQRDGTLRAIRRPWNGGTR